jgi:cell division protein ZapB
VDVYSCRLKISLTRLIAITLATTMTETHLPSALKNFEDKLDQLVDKYIDVKNENTSLKIKQETLAQEKAQLLEKTTQARTRVEAMITRLKAMEHGS